MSPVLNCLWSILFPSPKHVTFTESPAIPKADGDFGSSLQWLATQWRRKSSSSHKSRWFPPPHTSPYLQDQQCIIHFSAPPLLSLSQLIVPTSPPYSLAHLCVILLCSRTPTTTYHVDCGETRWNRMGCDNTITAAFKPSCFSLAQGRKKFGISCIASSKPGSTVLKVSGKKKVNPFSPNVTREKHCAEHLLPPLSADRASTVLFPRLRQFSSLFSESAKNSSHLLCETRVMVESRDLARGVRQHRPRPQRNSMRWWGGIFPTDWPGVQARRGQERVCNKETVQKSAPESHGNCSIVEKGRANLEKGVAMDKEDLK